MQDDVEYASIDCTLVARTKDAILVNAETPGGEEEIWIPISLILDEDYSSTVEEAENGEEMSFGVAEWFAFKNGLI